MFLLSSCSFRNPAAARPCFRSLSSEMSLPKMVFVLQVFSHQNQLAVLQPQQHQGGLERGTEGFDGTAFLGDKKETIFSVFRRRVWDVKRFESLEFPVLSALSICCVRCSHVSACYLLPSLLSLSLLSTCKAGKDIFPISACEFFQQW